MIHPVAEADEKSIYGSLSSDEFYAHHGVTHCSEYVVNPRDLKLFTQWWTPIPDESNPIVGVVGILHGYTLDSSWLLQLTAVHIAKHGFAVCAIDYQGHGYSEGLVAHIPDINPVVDDCISFFDSFRERHAPSKGMPSFLYAESLGGAIALLITLRRKNLKRPFDGVVLHGAMCGVSAKFKPPWPAEHLLSVVAAVAPTWQVVPTRGTIPELSFKVEWKRKLAMASPKNQKGRLRAATAIELVRVCRELQSRFPEVTIPFLIVHGGDDVVCDPAYAEDLYKHASSKDKMLKIYPGMWHLLVGEADMDVERVFSDVVDWLRTRAQRANGAVEGGFDN